MGENQVKEAGRRKLTLAMQFFLQAIKKVKVVNPSPQYGRKYHPPLTSSTKATLLF